MKDCNLYIAIMDCREASIELERVLNEDPCVSAEVDHTCLVCGNDPYEKLADIIPKNRIVYDFGAAYGFQAFWFRNHRKYVGIEPSVKRPFRTSNSEWYRMTAQEFLSKMRIEEDSFVICNYVPDKDAESLIRHVCPHIFVNYVTHGDCRTIMKLSKGDNDA